MRLTSPPSRRVVWEDGMHLAPQHFQAQRRYQEDQSSRTLDLLFPFAYGLSAVALDADALQNGTLALVHARGVLPDGTVFHTPDADPSPPPSALAERFSPTRDAHVVYLALPRWRTDAANVDHLDEEVGAREPFDANATPLRFQAVEEMVIDESTGADPLRVRFAARNLRLLLDDERTDDFVSMPIGRIRRDGRGQFQVDGDFIPPVLQLAACDALLELTRRTVSLLEAKGSALSATMSSAPSGAAGGAAAYVGNELATRWLLHAVRSADAPLRHLLLTRRAHPERLFLELSRLAGALSTFAMGAQFRDLPTYDHDHLTDVFAALELQLRAHLDVVISARAIVVPLAASTDVLHVATLSDARCFEPGTRWFLGVRADVGRAELVDRVQRLTKTCASKFVLELVRRAFNGLTTEHIPTPPAGLAPKPDLTYFELTLAGPCALSITDSREIGVYVPDALPGAYLEVAILLPSST
ncbi:type VI secretion system baseplate subunit TssK [Gemmatimonas sp.]|uniref:type VI secretion system baseplate subunit TssK n=1 Tax=Gemmatimonas sp. TaxID=1962908 RepID=UPI00286E21C6|nr:type VI secretion system baseplate subunit TssK [Gemmatimonas sp.]